MTNKSDFTEQEWEVVREGPPVAGLIVASASSGGSFRESWALAKSFAEARKQHGESELLDALVAEKPHAKRYGSSEELEQQGLERLGEAIGLLEQKASADEVEAYRRFTLAVAEHVAEAHKEGGTPISAEERQALDTIAATLNSSSRSG
jgi:hypothetical protein